MSLGIAIGGSLSSLFGKRRVRVQKKMSTETKFIGQKGKNQKKPKSTTSTPARRPINIWVIFSIIGLLLLAFVIRGDKKKAVRRKMAKVRRAKTSTTPKRKTTSRTNTRKKTTRRSPGRKKTKAEIKAQRLKNLAKARRALKAKKKR